MSDTSAASPLEPDERPRAARVDVPSVTSPAARMQAAQEKRMEAEAVELPPELSPRGLPKKPRSVTAGQEAEPNASPNRTQTADHPAPRPASGGKGSVGLTAPGVAVVSFIGCGAVAILDALFSPGLGLMFAIAFVAVSVYCAAEVRLRDLYSAVVVPPLTFLIIETVNALVGGNGSVNRRALDVAVALAEKAPVLWIGTLAAAAVAGYRWHRSKRRA